MPVVYLASGRWVRSLVDDVRPVDNQNVVGVLSLALHRVPISYCLVRSHVGAGSVLVGVVALFR